MNIQAALQSGTTVLPKVLNQDPGCYLGAQQYVYKQSIGTNCCNGSGAPAFIFVQQRDPITDPAVIQIP
jgi:hypothetical protein